MAEEVRGEGLHPLIGSRCHLGVVGDLQFDVLGVPMSRWMQMLGEVLLPGRGPGPAQRYKARVHKRLGDRLCTINQADSARASLIARPPRPKREHRQRALRTCQRACHRILSAHGRRPKGVRAAAWRRARRPVADEGRLAGGGRGPRIFGSSRRFRGWAGHIRDRARARGSVARGTGV